MTIVNFTPWTALMGGGLIGLSAAVLLYTQGRIAGISGIAGGVIYPDQHNDIGWRLVFIVSMVVGGFCYQWFGASLGLSANVNSIQSVVNKPTLIVAGLLVGIGTQMGSGCTSGHGICGLARRSPRSLVATLCFMGSALVTVFIVRHVFGGNL